VKDPKDCTCMCHRDSSVRHFVPCCGPFAITKEWVEKMAHLESDGEIGAGLPDHIEDMRAMVARATAAEAQIAVLRAKLEWYADQFCEGIGECVGDFCGKLTADKCAGCPARAALQETTNG